MSHFMGARGAFRDGDDSSSSNGGNDVHAEMFRSGSSPPYMACSKPLRKFVQTSYAVKSQFIGHIFGADS